MAWSYHHSIVQLLLPPKMTDLTIAEDVCHFRWPSNDKISWKKLVFIANDIHEERRYAKK